MDTDKLQKKRFTATILIPSRAPIDAEDERDAERQARAIAQEARGILTEITAAPA